MLMVFVLVLLGYIRMEKVKQEPPPEFVNQEKPVVVRGEVYKLTETQYSYEIYLKDISIFYKNKSYSCQGILVYLQTYPNLRLGNKIQVTGILKEFMVPRNEGEFNQYYYYKSKSLDYSMKSQSYKIVNKNYSLILDFLETIKNKVKYSYYKICSEKDYGIFSALILGETGELDAEINNLYKENGISHILSISGLHISLIGMGIYKLLRKRFYFGFSCTTSFILLFAYVALTGFSVSALRALLMFGISLLAIYLGRTYDMISATSLAAMLLLFENPFLVYHAGFLLSFGAVFGISMIHPIFTFYLGQKSPIISAASISVSVNLMTLPILSYFFFETSTYSLILNLLIIPPMPMLMISGILGGVLGTWSLFLGRIAIGLGHYVLGFYESICRLFSEFPNSTILMGRPKFWQIGCYYGILSLFLIYIKKKEGIVSIHRKVVRILIVFSVYILLIGVLSFRRNNGLRVTFLDVSQGDGIFMESKEGTTYLIDGGSTDIKKVGKYRMIPFFKSKAINHIDYAILTHGDTDHLSGLKELLDEESGILIKTLILPQIELKDEIYIDLENKARDRGVSIAYLKAGDFIIDGDLEIHCIHPSVAYRGSSKNGNSIVLSVSYFEFDMLLTGDLEMDGEGLILKEIKNLGKGRYEVLKVAHHGSKYSTSEEFLLIIRPNLSIISCGIDNSYGHPHKELIDRLEASESKILLTSECGGITIKTDGNKIEVERVISSTLKEK